MRMPQSPPSLPSLSESLRRAPERFARSLRDASATYKGRYLHWDKLRRLNPPAGMTHEDWWFGTRLARLALRKELPLRDAKGVPFVFGSPDPVPEHLHYIDQAAGGRIELTGSEIANPDVRDRYIVHSLIEEAITSSQLEGAATTREVAKDMIRSGRPPRDRGEQMILNNYEAIERIRELKDRPLGQDLVLDLHRILTHEALESPSAAGRFRNPDERVQVADPYNEVLHIPPPAGELPRRMEAMCDFANGKTPDYFVHPVIRAIALHFWLAYDHPFVDGNGRCARALFYWSMLRQGAWLCEFISISQIIRKAPAKYARAFLYTETDENDLTYFILYHLEIIRRAFDELRLYIARKASAVRQTEKLIRASANFNHRQLALLSHALRHPDARYTIVSHKTSHNVVHQTARTDLLDLARRGLLVQGKTGRRMHFTPVPDLEDRLKAQ